MSFLASHFVSDGRTALAKKIFVVVDAVFRLGRPQRWKISNYTYFERVICASLFGNILGKQKQ